MEERSAYDLLKVYPAKHGLEFDTQDDYRRFYLFPTDSMLDTKFVIFKTGSLYFYAFDSYTAKMYMSNTFTGLYGIANPNAPELKIYRKDFTDTFLRTNKRRTGIKHIDDRLTITSPIKQVSLPLSEKTVSLFLEMAKRFSPLHLLIENDYIQNITELKDKKVIGIETGEWLYKEEDVEEFLRMGGELIGSITYTK